MPQSCPFCKTWIPEVKEATCPKCGVDLNNAPKNVTEVPDRMTVAGNSAKHVAVALMLLLVMAGMGSALIRSLGEKDAALSVVFGLVILGCSVVLFVVIRQLIGWLRLL